VDEDTLKPEYTREMLGEGVRGKHYAEYIATFGQPNRFELTGLVNRSSLATLDDKPHLIVPTKVT
jgi:hypothetical protein